MISLKLFLIIYLFGGVTFIPLILYLWFINLPNKTDKNTIIDTHIEGDKQPLLKESSTVDPQLKAGEFDEKTDVSVFKKGWMTVTKQFYYHPSALPSNQENSDTTANILTLDQLNRKKNSYYCVLKHGNLFLYSDEPSVGLSHAVVLKNFFVTIWPREGISEASLFTKKTCIALFKNDYVTPKGKIKVVPPSSFSNCSSSPSSHPSENGFQGIPIDRLPTKSCYFLYFDNNYVKEDWYFALIDATRNLSSVGNISSFVQPPITAHFKTKDMLKLIQTINSTEGQLATKWLNVFLGRMFLSLQQNDKLANLIKEKLYTKLSKINKPDFLDDFKINSVDAGDIAPIFTNPKCTELNVEGDCKISVDTLYTGGLSLQISTIATLNIVGFRKPKRFPLEVSLKVNRLQGTLMLIMKRPPSNRIWYCFENEPDLDVSIEPVISSKQLSYNMVTNALKSKLRDALNESIVWPAMDDTVYYFPDSEQFYRGGIWVANTNCKSSSTGENGKDGDTNQNDGSGNTTSAHPNKSDDELNANGHHGNQENKEDASSAISLSSTSTSSSQDLLNPYTPQDPLSEGNDLNSLGSKKNTNGINANNDVDNNNRTSVEVVRNKTTDKVGNFKNYLKKKSADAGEQSHTDNSEENTGETKKYTKKFEKWYKNVKESAATLMNEVREDITNIEDDNHNSEAGNNDDSLKENLKTKNDTLNGLDGNSPINNGTCITSLVSGNNIPNSKDSEDLRKRDEETLTAIKESKNHSGKIGTNAGNVNNNSTETVKKLPESVINTHLIPEMISSRRKRSSITTTSTADTSKDGSMITSHAFIPNTTNTPAPITGATINISAASSSSSSSSPSSSSSSSLPSSLPSSPRKDLNEPGINISPVPPSTASTSTARKSKPASMFVKQDDPILHHSLITSPASPSTPFQKMSNEKSIYSDKKVSSINSSTKILTVNGKEIQATKNVSRPLPPPPPSLPKKTGTGILNTASIKKE
ncbi:uncharacterized protein SCODWIG_00906 [Saccharomycodes ludwigii]|uniref:SMP-LTD domain-containing protein n=1 Tax=Saccharomycodes ludwigii TaxID=36035 RepID=A0A376B377_9ASCO|nr:hypothetical protein SCDLUD_000527 [Saccharomycodes ludwigii]KAH3902928.1 hypothetical protein SCDLUD_000527 [Saccharomycodes ludwigii]SSD59145.1 uncharacterized protein SCODWIG_00906 [Saccharomycodes ludwigii]